MPSGGYLAPASRGEAEIRDRGSRFRAFVLPVVDEGSARSELQRLAAEYPDATHHCWAWRIGEPPHERSSDAGEPSGTAGAPILSVLTGSQISDVLAVVVRWFGGTKLGRGGLVRAYAGAVREALTGVPTLARAIEIIDESYGESALLVLRLARPLREEVEETLAGLHARFRERA